MQRRCWPTATRATLALLDRYRRGAESDARREVSALLRLERARAQGLVPGRAEAGRAEAELDAGLAELAAEPEPNEPSITNDEPKHRVNPTVANDDTPSSGGSGAPTRRPAARHAPAPDRPDGEGGLGQPPGPGLLRIK